MYYLDDECELAPVEDFVPGRNCDTCRHARQALCLLVRYRDWRFYFTKEDANKAEDWIAEWGESDGSTSIHAPPCPVWRISTPAFETAQRKRFNALLTVGGQIGLF